MKLIWATRGRTWGFRFLKRGGLADPLTAYEDAFAGIEDERETWRRVGDSIAVRFPDPLQREDSSGRVIPHDFVVLGPQRLVEKITSVDAAIQEIWPRVADDFAAIWASDDPSDDGDAT